MVKKKALKFDVKTHILVPKHTKVTIKEKKELLEKLARRPTRISQDYIGKLINAFETEDSGLKPRLKSPGEIPTPGDQPAALVDPLSERELQVLRLLHGTLSSSEIAEQLFLSPNTVRTHIKNIYRKLDVHGRAEAIQRSHELGLL